MSFFQRFASDLDPQVIVISVMTLVIMLGSSVISPVLPLLAQEFGVSYAGAGVLVAAFAVGRIPFDFIGGAMVDRMSPRLVASGGAAIVTISAALSAWATNFQALLWFRLLGGVGSALFIITAMAFLARTVTPQRMGRAMGFYQSMLLLGVSFGPTVGGFSASLFHSLRAPFWAMAVLSFVVTALCLRWIGEFPTVTFLQGQAVAKKPAIGQGAVAHLLRDATFRFVCILTFLIFAVRSGMMQNLIPLFAQQETGIGETGIGILQSLCSIANFAILWHAGRLLDRVGRLRVTLPIVWLMAGVILLCPWATTLPRLALISSAFGVVVGYLGPAPAAIIADIAPKGAVGSVMGMYRVSGDFGLLLGPVFVGWAAERFGFTWAFLTIATCTAFVALLGLGARETLASRQDSGA